MGRSRYKFTLPDKPHFLTLTVLHWIPVFTRPHTVAILLDSLRYLMKEDFQLYAYVILENHLHLLAQSPQLDKDIARYKSYTARLLIDYLKKRKVRTILDQLAFYKKQHKPDRVFQFWQEGAHPELIIDESMMEQKVDYIHQNPVKRGYVDLPEHWRYSSARNYVGRDDNLLDVTTVW
ncbi:REP-associated tyrosine transposase [Endozoicomonas sp.]|uniref:REP-associated tyrosine transposase n=1 Tax=Endozoicomonas sp. TaxID=1892382 RepID=UPI00383AFDA1